MIQYAILKISPRFLRWYRKFTLDINQLISYLPRSRHLLEVGCGVGSLTYMITQRPQDLKITAIDINQKNIFYAQKYNLFQSISFYLKTLGTLEGKYDCILFSDVIHHIPPTEYNSFFEKCVNPLNPNGYILIKDIPMKFCHLAFFSRQVYIRI